MEAQNSYTQNLSPTMSHNCKEVTYRVYSFVITLQGLPDILACDLNKHGS